MHNQAAEYNEQNLGGHEMPPEYKRRHVVRLARLGMDAAIRTSDPYGPAAGVAATATGAEAQVMQLVQPAAQSAGEQSQPLAA